MPPAWAQINSFGQMQSYMYVGRFESRCWSARCSVETTALGRHRM